MNEYASTSCAGLCTYSFELEHMHLSFVERVLRLRTYSNEFGGDEVKVSRALFRKPQRTSGSQ